MDIRNAADPREYQMIVFDYRKHITMRIGRNNLIRLGHFSDWFGFAHGLHQLAGEYQLSVAEAPAGAPAPVVGLPLVCSASGGRHPPHMTECS